jgi:uncharacterized protein YjbI with pentapeptide repeats
VDSVDFSGARLRGASFRGAKITGGDMRDADIEGDIGGLRVNGVDIAPLVAAELDRRCPDRVKLRAADPAGLADAWVMIEETWRATVARALALPEPLLSERVDDEWSFAETLRHLVFATDCWLLRGIRQLPRPYHPWGLAGAFLADPARLGIDPGAHPALAEILAVRRERMDAVRETIAGLTDAELERVSVPPDTPGHPAEPHTVLECLQVILEEEWEHNRYANRDLAVLESAR